MKFQAESDLVETLKTCLKSNYGRSQIKILEEVSLGYGIADIVISELRTDCLATNLSEDALDYNDINIFTVIKNAKIISLEGIIEVTRCHKRLVSQSIKKLITQGYIKVINDIFSLNGNYQMSFIRNFAIEAKLKDWKRALKQAYRYKWFAEYAFVVLDAHYSKAALKNLSVFEKYNVGLASVTVGGKLKRHFNPRKEMPLDPKMQMLLSEKIKVYELAR